MSRCKGVEWKCENLINFTTLLSRREVRIRVFSSYYHLLNLRSWWKVVFLIFILLFFFTKREKSSSHILSSHHIALGRFLPLTPYKTINIIIVFGWEHVQQTSQHYNPVKKTWYIYLLILGTTKVLIAHFPFSLAS